MEALYSSYNYNVLLLNLGMLQINLSNMDYVLSWLFKKKPKKPSEQI